MPDWTKSMQQTFEYYIVDPTSWKDSEKLDNILSSTITRDSEVDTLGSATIGCLYTFTRAQRESATSRIYHI